jgi:hypothetical protein
MHVNRKRSASAMTSPITDDEDFEYVSDTIRLVRF